LVIETSQGFYTKDHTTQIRTHTGCRIIEKAYKNGRKTKDVRLFDNHDPNCICGEQTP
jgi:hypothetical protein